MAVLPDLPQTEIAIVELTNAFRKENELGAVTSHPALAAAARAFAEYLARTGTFAHEADGREPQQRIEAQGYRHCLVAENLALNLDSRGFATAKLARDVVEGWKDSPGHRANMLLAGATEIGVGVARAPDKHPKFISVQLLARPEALKVEFRIENRTGGPVRYRMGESAHTLPVRTTVTHTSCSPRALAFEGAAAGPWQPAAGDRFVVRGEARALRVEVERRR